MELTIEEIKTILFNRDFIDETNSFVYRFVTEDTLQINGAPIANFELCEGDSNIYFKTKPSIANEDLLVQITGLEPTMIQLYKAHSKKLFIQLTAKH